VFADAIQIASGFTFPVAIAHRVWGGQIRAGAAAFIVLNSDGWIVTSSHVFDTALKADQDRLKVQPLQNEIDKIRSDTRLLPNYTASQVRRVEAEADRDWITNLSYWWARDGVTIRDLSLLPDVDLAIGRLDPFDSASVSRYPTLKNPALNFNPGRSLCRLGFPFHDITATFDPATRDFSMNTSFTFFPLDGIFTRTLEDPARTGKYHIKLIETSSHGRMGQSWGPIFDTRGHVWGIQSQTRHIPLGFDTEVQIGGRKVIEHQVINLGEGVHVETLAAVLTDLGVHFEMSTD
jgi:trypsin-like peptidase